MAGKGHITVSEIGRNKLISRLQLELTAWLRYGHLTRLGAGTPDSLTANEGSYGHSASTGEAGSGNAYNMKILGNVRPSTFCAEQALPRNGVGRSLRFMCRSQRRSDDSSDRDGLRAVTAFVPETCFTATAVSQLL